MTSNLGVIVASTRPGRAGLPIAQWFADAARAHAGFEVTLLDLKEVALPLFDEPHHPRLGTYEHEHTRRWSAQVAAQDAFVIVTPEYNHGTPPSLSNALCYLSREWAHKPAGFVSYGGIAAGARSVSMTKQILAPLKVVGLFESVAIPMFTQQLEDGRFKANPGQGQAATALLDELVRWAGALRTLRT